MRNVKRGDVGITVAMRGPMNREGRVEVRSLESDENTETTTTSEDHEEGTHRRQKTKNASVDEREGTTLARQTKKKTDRRGNRDTPGQRRQTVHALVSDLIRQKHDIT